VTPKKRATLWPVAAVGLLLGAAIGGGVIYLPTIATPALVALAEPQPTSNSAHFSQCFVGGGTNCVVDGDTFWAGGVKVRVSDIDAPETHPPHCPFEANLGYRATNRLQELLNDGAFQLEAGSRDEDVYGRKLRVVTRNGESLGMKLVSEGLAREWTGSRKPWC
jgi:endonuclease YncB( thermonuclease family)